jgi:hypothetical protein
MQLNLEIGKLYITTTLLSISENTFKIGGWQTSFLMDGEIVVPLDINIVKYNISEMRMLKTDGEIIKVRFRGNWRNYMIPVDEQTIL